MVQTGNISIDGDGPRPFSPWWMISVWLSTVMIAASLALIVASRASLITNSYILGIAPFAIVGGLVVHRRPENLIGRLLSAAGLLFGLGTLANSYLQLSLDVSRPLVALAAWLATWIWWPAISLVVVVVAVFPSGTVASVVMRRILQTGLALTAALTLLNMAAPVVVNTTFFDDDFTNPWTVSWLRHWEVVGVIAALLSTLILMVVSFDLVRRWKRSHGIERLQMRWVGFGLLVVAFLGLAAAFADFFGNAGNALIVVVWLGFGVLPVTTGLAVTRYRLFDIDRVVSRTLSYTMVVAILAGVYSTLAIGVPLVLRVSLDSPVVVASATLAAAALFNPARRRAQSMVDRRFNRAKYNADREVERFAERLRAEIVVEDLRIAMLAVVSTTLQPQLAMLWIRGSEWTPSPSPPSVPTSFSEVIL